MMRNAIRKIHLKLKTEIKLYRLVLKDKRTPLGAKILLSLAVGYFFMPFDIIPDFIPVIGHLDDAVIIPGLVYLALKLIPKEIIEEHRAQLTLNHDFQDC
jgi:uncharacterized membrane protein YkvA (DUF1232 family)